MENTIKINLFGNIRLTNNSVNIDESMIHSNRLLTLLAFLIVHRREKVPNKAMCKQLIGDEYKNPEGTLKNLMYRLRGMLKALGPEEYVCTLSGEYRWNPEIPVETDYERFEELYMQICTEQDSGRKRDLCVAAVECYNGNFSSEIAGEKWIVSLFVQNQMRYVEIIKLLGQIYEEKNEWASLEQLCRDALDLEPFEEEIHGQLIRSLQRQKKYSQAMDHYETAKKIFYENFGIWNPEKLQISFEEEAKELLAQTMSLADIQKEFGESCRPGGAFFCNRQIFQQLYRVEARRIGRMGISGYLLLMTVRRQRGMLGRLAVDAGMMFGVETLEKLLRRMLRMGDVVMRCSQTQFVALLSACSYEAGVAVAERIYRDFRKKMRNRKLDLRYELSEIYALPHKMEVNGT